jgi:hypothetical protein
MSRLKRLAAIVAAVAMWAVIQPGTVSAQTSGVGRDGYTRSLWFGTDGRISVWKLDPNLNFVTSHDYGPYAGYSPVALTAASNNNIYVLWRYSDGSISLWLLDPNLNYVTSHLYGPYSGYTAIGLGPYTDGTTNNFHVIWRYTDGSWNVWLVDQNLNYIASRKYGPFFGWEPGFAILE